MDHSAIEAIFTLAGRYAALGKKLHLRHLSVDCQELLLKAQAIIETDTVEDPVYRVADNRLA